MAESLEAAVRAARKARVSYHVDAATRASAERDFGGIAKGRCLLIAEPSNAESCERLINELASAGIGCTLRGTGYGQSGQSVALDTVALSTRRMDDVAAPDLASKSICVGAGASVRRVLDALEGSGLTPPVLPLNLDMSVGGLLSAGGVGPTSHRHGTVAENVAELQMVTPSAGIQSCTRETNANLFNAALGGMGQAGLITQARLALDHAPEAMRSYYFLYEDPDSWLMDQLAVTRLDADVHIEGFCFAAGRSMRSTTAGVSARAHWAYGLHLAVDAKKAQATELSDLLGSLRATRLLDQYETSHRLYLQRYALRFSGMVQTGAWHAPHPWLEVVVPIDRSLEMLARTLETLPAEAGDGHRFMLLRGAPRQHSMIDASDGLSAAIGVFPFSLPSCALPAMLDCVERLTSLALDVGGRRYLSGWLGRDPEAYLRRHFAERYDDWLAMRKTYDPKGILRSALFSGQDVTES